jgi:hypothetical protein
MQIIDDAVEEIIGFDLGHGESALTIATVSAITEPQVLDIQNQRSFITAVATHPKRGILIGEEAYIAKNLETLYVSFKSAELDSPQVRQPIKLFVSQILTLLLQNDMIRGGEKSLFIVGCPSGWSEKVRERYAQLMHEAGMSPVKVVAESRAAFIHAKESNELHISADVLQRSVLIIDIGSSTTDFTAVQNFNEHYIDFGDIALGAGLIDKAILKYVFTHHERQAEIREIFNQYPQYEALCELKCRQVKETYFANESRWIDEPISDTLKLPTPQPIFFDIELKQEDMVKILSSPMIAQLSWPAALEQALIAAKRQMVDSPPELIFLTGGASRMGFIAQLCKVVFSEAQVIRGKEPELSIAKGLAWTGRIDKKTAQFRREIEAFFQTGQLHQWVEQNIPQLFEKVAEKIIEELPDQVILPAFRRWQRGDIKTLNDLETVIEQRTEAWLTSTEGKQAIMPAVAAWFQQISPAIEAQINPLCDRYHIPRTAFSLLTEGAWQGRLPTGLVTDTSQLWGFDGMNTITGLIVAIIIANLAGGSGIALILEGPIGLIIGLIVGLVAFAIGKQTAEWWVKKTDLYLWLRQLAGETRLKNKLVANQKHLQTELVESLQQNTETLRKITHDVDLSIREQINQAVESVVLLIK